jgi:hypothetical protein
VLSSSPYDTIIGHIDASAAVLEQFTLLIQALDDAPLQHLGVPQMTFFGDMVQDFQSCGNKMFTNLHIKRPLNYSRGASTSVLQRHNRNGWPSPTFLYEISQAESKDVIGVQPLDLKIGN